MLFRRSAYDAIGGHRAHASEVVEVWPWPAYQDHGLHLRYVLGLDAVDLRMYRVGVSLGRLDQKLVSGPGCPEGAGCSCCSNADVQQPLRCWQRRYCWGCQP